MKPDYRVDPSHKDPDTAPADTLAEAGADEAESPGGDEAERRACVVSTGMHGSRLDKALVVMAPEFSRSYLQTLIDGGHVMVDGKSATTASRKVLAGQHVSIELIPTPQSRAFHAQEMQLAILYEDEHLLVIDKPAGLVVHPASGNWSGTLLNGLLAHHGAAAGLPRAGIVHRLDKDTSGVMVVGKTLPAVTALVRAIAARTVHRRYLAIGHGAAAKRRWRIEAPIGRDPQSRVRMAVVASGKPAMTDVECIAHIDGFSALRCTLHTGRTHQIRVHLASSGYPLVADAVYGGMPALGMERQALHAERLEFVHPATGLPCAFEAALPSDFAAAWARVVSAS